MWTPPLRTQRIMAYYAQGLTLKDMGEKVGVSGPAMHKWLRRRDLPTDQAGRQAWIQEQER